MFACVCVGVLSIGKCRLPLTAVHATIVPLIHIHTYTLQNKAHAPHALLHRLAPAVLGEELPEAEHALGQEDEPPDGLRVFVVLVFGVWGGGVVGDSRERNVRVFLWCVGRLFWCQEGIGDRHVSVCGFGAV